MQDRRTPQAGINIIDEKKLHTIKSVSKMQRAQPAPSQSAIKSLPDAIQKSLDEFIIHIKDVWFFVPDGKPNAKWVVSYADMPPETDTNDKGFKETSRYAGPLERARARALYRARQSPLNISLGTASDRPSNAWNREYWETNETLVHLANNCKRGEASREAIDRVRNAALNRIWGKAKEEVWREIKDIIPLEGPNKIKNDDLNAMINSVANPVAMEFASAAVLMARAKVVQDIDFALKDTHTSRAARRMEVWEKGYCLAADINGILYAYSALPIPPEQLRMRI